MAYDNAIADRFRKALRTVGTIDEKQMFGSLGFMVNNKLTICVGDVTVMYRFSLETCKSLVEQGIAQPAVMGTRTMKNWVCIPSTALADKTKFERYIRYALEYNEIIQ